MTDSLKEFIDEHDLDATQVIDALEIDPAQFADTPEAPTDFYDGEPSVEDLADDFDAVDLLVDEKENLEAENDELREQAREAQRPVFEDKAEKLAEMTEKWGDKADLMEQFDAEDEDERLTVDDLADKIELVEDIKGESTTTVANDGGGEDDGGTDVDAPTTDSGKYILSDTISVGE